ncbi:hypothetical protein CXB51_026289 [Gossypium anomalum]|uniref:Aminotransferase-like plant mobile domain-containing protein n=1 Tax=Gossypium anomalum TaxID=47600 RepID=A0A8J5YLC3_9ROSI|nr:hypothetical protein CXB51_026289 [Gossypium anomalum]
MLVGYKLDHTLISALVERWRPETHIFHFSCDECTITLEDVALQLGLPMDGPIITGSVVIPSKKDFSEAFLGKLSNKFYSGRIDTKWLETNFKYLPTDTPDIVKEQYAQTFIHRLIGGILMLDKSQNLVHISHGPGGGYLFYVPSEQPIYVSISDKETNFAVTARHKSIAQAGSTREEQQELARLPQGVYRHLGSSDRILTHPQAFFLIEHDDLFGVHTLVQSSRQVVSTIGGGEE